tara:strand:+ start:447 stop:551 length:105 start_codon:yes stop_codon:yes gene_type:complete
VKTHEKEHLKISTEKDTYYLLVGIHHNVVIIMAE